MMDYREVVKDAIERFEDMDEHDGDALCEVIEDAIMWETDLLAVILGLGNTDKALHGESIHDYAFELLESYLLDNDLVNVED